MFAISRIAALLTIPPPPKNSQAKNADDIVITYAARTPLTKARKGGFKDTSLESIIYLLLKEVNARSGLDPALVEDICLGNVSLSSSRLGSATWKRNKRE